MDDDDEKVGLLFYIELIAAVVSLVVGVLVVIQKLYNIQKCRMSMKKSKSRSGSK